MLRALLCEFSARAVRGVALAPGVRAVLVGATSPTACAAADGWIASLADTSVDALAAYGSEQEEIVG